MKIKPIIISEGERWKYGLIAVLVDREDFLTDVERIRKRFKIRKLLPYSLFNSERKRKVKTIYSPENTLELFGELPNIAEYLCTEYKVSRSFKRVIYLAIMSGEVSPTDLDVKPRFLDVREMIYREVIPIEPYEAAIIVTPQTSIKEIKELIEQLHELTETVNARGDIKTIRDWYWMHKSGMTYKDIKQSYNIAIEEDSIKKAINRYNRLLRGDIQKAFKLSSPHYD